MKRKQTSKRILGILLTLCMVATLLPVMSMTALAADTPSVTVTDGALNSSLPSGMTWDKASSTLTLNGYNGGSICFGKTSTADGEVTIKLVGSNTITVNDTTVGISFNSITKANFTGSGSLTIKMSNNGENYYRTGIGYLNSAGSFATELNFKDTVTVTINVNNTQEQTACGIEGINTGVLSDMDMTIAEGATLNINMTSNSTYATRAIRLMGSATINGTLNITGNYTGSGTISSYDWSAFVCNVWSASTIGANAAITIDYPTSATCGNVDVFKLVGNDNNAVTDWEYWADGHSDYTGRLFYVKRSDKNGGDYADYLYKKSTLVDAAVTVTEPVVGATPNTTATSGDSYKYTVGSVVWQEKDGDTLYGVTTFEAGKIYRAKVRVTPAEAVYINSVKINGKTATYTNEYGQPGYYVTFGLMTDTMASTTLTGTNDPATGKPKLTWKAVSGAAKYEIYRYDSASNTYVKMISTTGTTFTNTSAVAGKTYSYKVKAIGSSSSMTSITAPISVTCKYPTPKVVGSNNPATGKNVLNWEKVTGATKYEIYRYDSASSSYIKLITTSGTTFTNTSAKPGYIYYYKVKAIGSVAAAASNFSDKVKLTCKYPTPKVTGSNNPATGKNVLNWEKVEGATKYEIYRYDSASNSYIKLITTAGTTFTNTSAKPGYIYYYKVKAIGSVADAASNFSDKVKLTCKCAAPKVTGSNTTTGKPKLTWEKVTGATKYEIYRYDSASSSYIKLITTTGTTFTHTSAKPGYIYYYKVKALGATTASDSAMSEKVKVTCK